ncbi:hypothetical protein HYFRA_00009516 [Hymenoscyphus fraxineus]|uniref:Cell wall protein YJL171C/Tos1 N-terminal domain-containing protein n=1 Tax=Hymenoscyphus fraxineus TaxID=746836 RepID=A0A9N9L0W3_9HELO|nr:hypothetical protein HYFRA_00009516 [Hymenoscyphus fraxineus]
MDDPTKTVTSPIPRQPSPQRWGLCQVQVHQTFALPTIQPNSFLQPQFHPSGPQISTAGTPTHFNVPLAPLDEELSLHLRGPAQGSDFLWTF